MFQFLLIFLKIQSFVPSLQQTDFTGGKAKEVFCLKNATSGQEKAGKAKEVFCQKNATSRQ